MTVTEHVLSRLKNIGVVIFSGSMFAVKAPVLQVVNTPNASFCRKP